MQRTGLVASRHVLAPQAGIEPMSLALEGGFLSTRQPGKSLHPPFFKINSLLNIWASLVAQLVKSLRAEQETTYSAGDVGQSRIKKIPWRRARQTTPVVLPGEFHEQTSGGLHTVHGTTRVGHDLAPKLPPPPPLKHLQEHKF